MKVKPFLMVMVLVGLTPNGAVANELYPVGKSAFVIIKIPDQRNNSKCNIELTMPDGAKIEREFTSPNYEETISFKPSIAGRNTIKWEGKYKSRGLNSVQACTGKGELIVDVLPINTALSAEDYERLRDAKNLYRDKKYAEGFPAVRDLALKGVTQAQVQLAISYFSGFGVTRDFKEAFKWAEVSSSFDDKAKALLGHLYLNGLGVPQTCPAAIKNLDEAMAGNAHEAYGSMAFAYANGKCVARDFTQAIRFAKKANELGNVASGDLLGVLTERGLGTEKNIEEAKAWYKKAADAGNVGAKRNLESLIANEERQAIDREKVAKEAEAKRVAELALKKKQEEEAREKAIAEARERKKAEEEERQKKLAEEKEIKWKNSPEYKRQQAAIERVEKLRANTQSGKRTSDVQNSVAYPLLSIDVLSSEFQKLPPNKVSEVYRDFYNDAAFVGAGYKSAVAALEICVGVQGERLKYLEKVSGGEMGPLTLRVQRAKFNSCNNWLNNMMEDGFAVRSEVSKRVLSIKEKFKYAEDTVVQDRGVALKEMVRIADEINDLLQLVVTRAISKVVAEYKNGGSSISPQTAVVISSSIDSQRERSNARQTNNEILMATISCGLGTGDHINILACFAGGRDGLATELEIRNGSKYGLYKLFNINELGVEDSQGLNIQLNGSYSIVAQNASRNLTLTVTVRDTNGGIRFQRSAGQYGFIRVSN